MGRKIESMNAEVIESPLSSKELAARYRALCDDPMYEKVPGKIELDTWGRMVMTPPSYYHGRIQARLCQRLAALGGETSAETPIATAMGLFVADAAWGSPEFIRAHGGETPLMRAPEICVEVVSPSNSAKEIEEKRIAYLATGAEEVWILYLHSKRYEFHGKQGLLERSRFAVDLAGIFD
jgi:Uma2 family endonuclease